MASKWLRAFLETEEPSVSPHVESVDSANMSMPRRPAGAFGTIGTIGTAPPGQEKAGYAAELADKQELPSAAAMGRANSANSAKRSGIGTRLEPFGTNDPNGTDNRERDQAEATSPGIEEGAGAPRSWLEGYAAMLAMAMPSGFSPERWKRIVDATGSFLDRWADPAIACGWSTLDAFGVDADRPDARFDCMGLVLLLDRCGIVAVDEAGADLVTTSGARQRFRRRPLPLGTVPLWRLVRR
jgi:hypothetical protein